MQEFPKKSQALCAQLGLRYPVFQAGMVWVSGGKLAAAAANAGILGTIGAGSMRPDLLREQIKKAKLLTSSQALSVNVPLLYRDSDKQIKVALEEGIKIFITSAGSPKKFTKFLKEQGATVIHVTSHPDLARKCEDAGCDMVIAEGFEAGGHNGRDEITSLVLLPQVVKAVQIPVIAAGGFASGESLLAAFSLEASAVQMGTRFVCAQESSAHENFQNAVCQAQASDTKLMMKNLVPVRLLKNRFYEEVEQAEARCASSDELAEILGKGRAKAGMLEGDLDKGELEIGQISALIQDRPSTQEIVQRIYREYSKARAELFSQ